MPTAKTSVVMRDVSKKVADILKDDYESFQAFWSNLEELEGDREFHSRLGQAMACKVDWADVKRRLKIDTVPRSPAPLPPCYNGAETPD